MERGNNFTLSLEKVHFTLLVALFYTTGEGVCIPLRGNAVYILLISSE